MSDLIEREALLESVRKWIMDTSEIRDSLGRQYNKGLLRAIKEIQRAPAVDAEPVRHGKWMLEAHDERVNYRWNVTAECSECCNGHTEIWAGFFPITPGCIAKDIALQSAAEVKLSNYCPNCGARMGEEG